MRLGVRVQYTAPRRFAFGSLTRVRPFAEAKPSRVALLGGEAHQVIILAISNAALAAGASLLGVVVGGVLSTVTELYLTRSRERADARAGARLVQVDLRAAAGTIEAARHLRYWTPGTSLAVSSWDSHRAVLASQLEPAHWDAVATSIDFLKSAEDIDRRRGLAQTEAQPLDLILDKVLGAARYRAIVAHNSLCAIARTTELEQATIEDPDGER